MEYIQQWIRYITLRAIILTLELLAIVLFLHGLIVHGFSLSYVYIAFLLLGVYSIGAMISMPLYLFFINATNDTTCLSRKEMKSRNGWTTEEYVSQVIIGIVFTWLLLLVTMAFGSELSTVSFTLLFFTFLIPVLITRFNEVSMMMDSHSLVSLMKERGFKYKYTKGKEDSGYRYRCYQGE